MDLIENIVPIIIENGGGFTTIRLPTVGNSGMFTSSLNIISIIYGSG